MDLKAKIDTLTIPERILRNEALSERLASGEFDGGPQSKKILSSRDFKIGQKLILTVTVTDEEIAQLLMDWIYSKDENGHQLEFLGCKLSSIGYSKSTEDIKKKLIEFIEKL